MNTEFNLTGALAIRERLECPTLAAAHDGTALRERLNSLASDWDDARARRDLIESQTLQATAGAKSTVRRLRAAIAGLQELIAEKEAQIEQTENLFSVAFETSESACIEIERMMHAERVKLRLIASLRDN
jgi:predicted  nucleic acid-binding Zn-ribbon protein